MKINVKKLDENAVIPSYAMEGDAGMDLTAVRITTDFYQNIIYHTGLAFEIPEGYVGLLFPRSSNFRKDLWLTNHVGVIDSGYRGEVTFKYRHTDTDYPSEGIVMCNDMQHHPLHDTSYNVGDRVGQIVIIPIPHIKMVEVDHLAESKRGTNGYGSTGK